MGIEAFVVSQVVSAAMGAKAASDEAKLNIEREESAEKSRALAATMEFNDMMASNIVAGSASGISLGSQSFLTAVKSNEMNFRLNRASDRITTGNKQREYKRRANAAKTKALISMASTVAGGYNQKSMLAPKGQDFNYFGMTFNKPG